MCDPVSATAAIGLALNVGSAVLDHKAQNKQANAVKASALESLKLQNNELSIREVQERIAGAQQIEQGNREVQAASGDIKASAAARGIGGLSLDLLLGDVVAQGARFKTSVDQNTEASVSQLERGKDEALAEAHARIAGAPKASNLATGLKIGAAGLNAYTQFKINRKPT
jgi:hypothetical protein